MTLLPAQKFVGPEAVITGVTGVGATDTDWALDVAVQPPGYVTVTVNVPLVLTTIDCVVSPFDQE